jgi:hypothetical protein
LVKQSNESEGGSRDSHHRGCGCEKDGSGSSQSNESAITQGDPSAHGGDATATGGRGGDANTGNTQEYNGNAYARSEPKEEPKGNSCGCEHRGKGGGHGHHEDNDANAEGGDTTARSGDAHGGDGGDADADGGDAAAFNAVKVFQSNLAGLASPRG